VSEKEEVTPNPPAEVMDAVRREAPPQGYGEFIAETVTYCVEERRGALRQWLIAGYQANAARDHARAEMWRPLG
jgi:hypothetical protein